MSSILSIPKELHLEIISYLSVTDCKAVGQVHPNIRPIYSASSWKHCTLIPCSTQGIDCPDSRYLGTKVFLHPSRYKWFYSWEIHSVNITLGVSGNVAKLFEDFSLKQFQSAYPNLKKIKWQTISNADTFTQMIIPVFFGLGCNVELSFRNSELLQSTTFYNEKIHSLKIGFCSDNSISKLINSLPHFSNIKNLHLNFQDEINEHLYIEIISTLSHLKSLKSLELENCYFSKPFFTAIQRLPQNFTNFKVSFEGYDSIISRDIDDLVLADMSIPQITHLCGSIGRVFLHYPSMLSSLKFPRVKSVQMSESDIIGYGFSIKPHHLFVFPQIEFLDIKVSDFDSIISLHKILKACQNLKRVRILRTMSPAHYTFANSFNTFHKKISPQSSKKVISEILKIVRLEYGEEILAIEECKNSNLKNQAQDELLKKIKFNLPQHLQNFEKITTLLRFMIDPFRTSYPYMLQENRIYWIQVTTCGFWERIGSTLMNQKNLEYAEIGYCDSGFQVEKMRLDFTKCDIRPLDTVRFHKFVANHPKLKQLMLINCSTQKAYVISPEERQYSFGKAMKKGSRLFNNGIDFITLIDKEAINHDYNEQLQKSEIYDYYLNPKKHRKLKPCRLFNKGLNYDRFEDLQNFKGWK